jgi:hypothetical protein
MSDEDHAWLRLFPEDERDEYLNAVVAAFNDVT